MSLKVIKRGFGGFTRIFSGVADFRGFSHEQIRVIRENPLNPCPLAVYLHMNVNFNP
ncbi:MAG: hypothetical protein FWG87_14930 [Defluviitaleaceae bacterium]|nr:hypothetical protein [Defluviitaleaceae bacterium]